MAGMKKAAIKKAGTKTAGIIMYYGKECPHCHAMIPLLDKLEKEAKVKIERKEIWHDEDNADEMRLCQDIIAPACGGDMGVPCFLNKNKKKALCGEISYKEFKEWVLKNK